MKKVFISIFLFIGVLAIYFSFSSRNENMNISKKTQKKQTRVPASVKALDSESLRRPNANVKAEIKKSYFSDKGKVIDKPADVQEKAPFNPEWKNLLQNKLKKSFDEKTQVKVTPKGTYNLVKGDKVHYQEKVLIQVELSNGHLAEYMALVDSSSGKILSRWGQTYKTRKPVSSPRVFLTPSGEI